MTVHRLYRRFLMILVMLVVWHYWLSSVTLPLAPTRG